MTLTFGTAAVEQSVANPSSLEFAIVVNAHSHPELYELGQHQLSRGTDPHRTPADDEIRIDGVLRARWIPVALGAGGKPKIERLHRDELLRPTTLDGRSSYEMLVLNEPDPNQRITGADFVSAYVVSASAGRAIAFKLNQEGGYRLHNLTWRYQPTAGDPHRTKLAILWDGCVHSAPNINAVIGADGMIEGSFSSQEIQALLAALNSAAVPAAPGGALGAWASYRQIAILLMLLGPFLAMGVVVIYLLVSTPRQPQQPPNERAGWQSASASGPREAV